MESRILLSPATAFQLHRPQAPMESLHLQVRMALHHLRARMDPESLLASMELSHRQLTSRTVHRSNGYQRQRPRFILNMSTHPTTTTWYVIKRKTLSNLYLICLNSFPFAFALTSIAISFAIVSISHVSLRAVKSPSFSLSNYKYALWWY